MSGQITIKRDGQDKWMHMEGVTAPDGIEDRCTTKYLQTELSKRVKGIKVTSAEANTTGELKGQTLPYLPIPGRVVSDMPNLCDIQLEHTMPSGRVQYVRIIVPYAWNRRFLGATGGGNRCDAPWYDYQAEYQPTMGPIRALYNGFAVGITDGANRDANMDISPLDPETHELDLEMLRNWSHLAMHWVAIIGKATCDILQGTPVLYSYLYGTSGGGAQVPILAQFYPQDYDGYYALGGPIDYPRTTMMSLWPLYVMKEYGILPPSKLEAFRKAAIDSIGGVDAFAATTERIEFAAAKVIGQDTLSGKITGEDAKVMQMIWDGPISEDGRLLAKGFRPGTSLVFRDGCRSGVISYFYDEQGNLAIKPILDIGLAMIGAYYLREPKWDWKDISLDEYLEIYEAAAEKFKEFAGVNPDLTMLRDSGSKMILVHGVADGLINPEFTFDWYDEVVKLFGNKNEVKDFFRFFPMPAMSHTFPEDAYGPCTAEVMTTLMNWVENGIVPDTLSCERYTNPNPPENPDDEIGQPPQVIDWAHVEAKDIPCQ
jgi:feruloyl esterase